MRFASLSACLFLFVCAASPNADRTLDDAESRAAGFHFTWNWTADRAPTWKRVLSPLREQPGIKMLEIGTLEGRSAIWFLDNILTGKGSMILCVDIFGNGLLGRWTHNIELAGYEERAAAIERTSQQALWKITPQSFDVIYIDGCHQPHCVFLDTAFAWQLLKPGGFLIWDDYGPGPGSRGRIQPTVDLFLASFAQYIEILDRGYQVIVRKTGETY